MQNNMAANQYQGNAAMATQPQSGRFQPVSVQVYSGYCNAPFTFDAQLKQDENGQHYYCLLHNSIKSVMLGYMAKCANDPHINPISVSYHPIETSLSHAIVDCTVSQGSYVVTETGETSIATLNTAVAKEYPYIEAQIRAYDRAMISFLQLNVDGKRLYSDHEFAH